MLATLPRTRGGYRATVLLLVLAAGCVLPAGPVAEDSPAWTCPFCRSPQPDVAFLCTRCGRLSRVPGPDPAHRFWGDAFYIFRLPSIESRPDLTAKLGPEGLLEEVAAFDLGDRYLYEVTPKGVKITGKVRARETKEVAFVARVEDRHDPAGRIRQRTVHGEMRADPPRFLYRRIDYDFEGSRFRSAEIGSWVYTKAKSWEKEPASWIRHTKVDVRFAYADGVLSEVHVEKRNGVRDLRGNADYELEGGFSEAVVIDNGKVMRFGEPQRFVEETP